MSNPALIIGERDRDGVLRWTVTTDASETPSFSSGPFDDLDRAIAEATLWVSPAPPKIVRVAGKPRKVAFV